MEGLKVAELTAAAASVDRTSDTARLVLPAAPDTIAAVAALCAAETETRCHLDITATQLTLTIHASGPGGLPRTLVPAGVLSHGGAIMLADPALGGNAPCQPPLIPTRQPASRPGRKGRR